MFQPAIAVQDGNDPGQVDRHLVHQVKPDRPEQSIKVCTVCLKIILVISSPPKFEEKREKYKMNDRKNTVANRKLALYKAYKFGQSEGKTVHAK
jgi:hypothetical protein